MLGTLCEADISLFESWEFTLTVDDESILTESGKEEQRRLGHRFRMRFPGLLDEPFSRGKYVVGITTYDVHYTKYVSYSVF